MLTATWKHSLHIKFVLMIEGKIGIEIYFSSLLNTLVQVLYNIKELQKHRIVPEGIPMVTRRAIPPIR